MLSLFLIVLKNKQRPTLFLENPTILQYANPAVTLIPTLDTLPFICKLE